MGKDVSRILAIAEPIAVERGLEVLDIELGGTASNPIVRVLLDCPDDSRRVSVEDCQAVSQRLGDGLEAYEVLSSNYMLEVSSPGVNRPLKKVEHFQRVVGSKVKFRTKSESGLPQTRIGRLEEVDGTGITVILENGVAERVAMNEIEKANLEFEFEQKPARKKRR